MSTVAAAGILVAGNYQANAQSLCTTTSGPCASLPQQLLDYARQAEQLVQETQTAEQELINTINLPGTVYRDLTGDIAQLESIRSTANMLTGFTGQILTNISSDHGYPDLSNFHQQFSNEASAVALALKAAASILSLQPGQLTQDATILAALNTQGMAGAGRQQTLQTLGGTTASAAQAIQKLQSATSGNQQALMTWVAATQDHQYLVESVSDRDLEIAWVLQCQAVASLGGALPAGCAGSQ